jgi:FAD/FMN-containing dehydrogenase
MLPPETLDRLRKLKAQYDPDNVFNQNFAIPPADVRAEAGSMQPVR